MVQIWCHPLVLANSAGELTDYVLFAVCFCALISARPLPQNSHLLGLEYSLLEHQDRSYLCNSALIY